MHVGAKACNKCWETEFAQRRCRGWTVDEFYVFHKKKNGQIVEYKCLKCGIALSKMTKSGYCRACWTQLQKDIRKSRICLFPGCTKSIGYNSHTGFCIKHWHQSRPKQFDKSIKTKCSYLGCENYLDYRNQSGLCRKHYLDSPIFEMEDNFVPTASINFVSKLFRSMHHVSSEADKNPSEDGN